MQKMVKSSEGESEKREEKRPGEMLREKERCEKVDERDERKAQFKCSLEREKASVQRQDANEIVGYVLSTAA